LIYKRASPELDFGETFNIEIKIILLGESPCVSLPGSKIFGKTFFLSRPKTIVDSDNSVLRLGSEN
jgi:hypothetical protein